MGGMSRRATLPSAVHNESGEWTDECAWEPSEQPAVPREDSHWILSVHPALVEHYAGGSGLDQS